MPDVLIEDELKELLAEKGSEAGEVLIAKGVQLEKGCDGSYDVTKAYNMIMDGECGTFSSVILDCLSKSREKLEALYVLSGQQEQQN